MKINRLLLAILILMCSFFEAVPRVTSTKIIKLAPVQTDYFLGIPCAEYPSFQITTKDSDGKITNVQIAEFCDKRIRFAGHLISASIALLGIGFIFCILYEYGKLPVQR